MQGEGLGVISENLYDRVRATKRFLRLRNIKAENALHLGIAAIERKEADAVINLSVTMVFDAARSVDVFGGRDPDAFVPDPLKTFRRCALCGMDLRNAFDNIQLHVEGHFTPAKYSLEMHAACLNAALGKNSKLDVFEYMDAMVPPAGDVDRTDLIPRPSEWPEVAERALDTAGIYLDADAVSLRFVEVSPKSTILQVLARYAITNSEVDSLLAV